MIENVRPRSHVNNFGFCGKEVLMVTMRPAFGYGKARKSTPSTTQNMAVVAPVPTSSQRKLASTQRPTGACGEAAFQAVGGKSPKI
jgi:hypothetical protein